MNKIDLLLTEVPLPVLIFGPVLVLVAFLVVPQRLRMGAAIAFMMFWLILGMCVDLRPMSAIAKTTGFLVYVLVAITAWRHPGPRRPVPPFAWMYVFIGFLSYLFILTVWDIELALIIRTQWLLLVLSALLVARTVVDQESLEYVMWAITLGLGATLILPLSELILHPGSGFKNRRFAPYGSNANQMGVLFGMAAPLCLYGAMQVRSIFPRLMLIGCTAAAAGMGVLTGSRSTMALMLGMSLPLVLSLTRRPVLTVLAGGALFVGVNWFLSLNAQVDVDRMGSLRTGRVGIAEDYIRDVISERPMLGLLETSGESFLRTEEQAVGHVHNAYLQTIYVGGVVFATPVFIVTLYTMWVTFVMWKGRKHLPYDPLLISFLAAIMIMIYAHGFVNGQKDHPTTTIAFGNVFFSVLIMGLARDLSRGTAPMRQVNEELEWIDVEYEQSVPAHG